MQISHLLSGGVDSSVALFLAKEQGFSVFPFYIKIWMEGDLGFGNCPWEEDLVFAEDVCKKLGLNLEIVSLQKEYWDLVVNYTIDEVKSGRTPNPDMMCNKLIKFGAFYKKFGKNFDKISTGHYAKTQNTKIKNQNSEEKNIFHLMKAKDKIKDQTYFLSQLSYDQISKSFFSLGDLEKSEVRSIAKKQKFLSANRPDSQGICFLGKINYKKFLERYVGKKSGKIIEKENGKILGEHNGFWFYTIGQRSGLNLAGGPWFVVEKNESENEIFVANGYDPDEKYVSEIFVENFNFINQDIKYESRETKNFEKEIKFKIRHAPNFESGKILKIFNENKNSDLKNEKQKFLIKSDKKISGVAKGQFAVIYYEDECLGGGVIC
ncbi:MAG: tRNA 2-thiouridine(34) synthase MnmA [Patescibacteria group bacterium]